LYYFKLCSNDLVLAGNSADVIQGSIQLLSSDF